MKSLFLKDRYNYGGPWVSFDYHSVDPLFILKNSFAKPGHPFPMICLMEMDCRIVDSGFNALWLEQAIKEAPKYLHNVSKIKYTNLENVDFSNYDFVYSEDPILPKDVILNNPKTIFAYNDVEHSNRSQNEFYDLHFDHLIWDFPHSLNAIQKIPFTTSYRVFLEYRTASYPPFFENIISELGNNVTYNPTIFSGGLTYGMSNPLSNGLDYWSRLKSSTFHIILPSPHPRVGQACIDAAACGTVNIGFVEHKINFIHPECRTSCVKQALNLVRQLETCPVSKFEIIKYQYQQVRKAQSKFISAINLKFKDKVL